MNRTKQFFILAVAVTMLQSTSVRLQAQRITAHPLETITLSFAGKPTCESADESPFTNTRLQVTFKNGDHSYTVRGYYGADGNAAETGADSGNIWQCRFATDITGFWSYKASLRRGDWIAINHDPEAGDPIEITDSTGTIEVKPWGSATTQSQRDFRRRGRVIADTHWFRLADAGDYLLKAGTNSPENLLAYVDFDDTFRIAANQRSGEAKATDKLHRFQPHREDWQDGDPSWRGGKGKSLVGAINYLASTGMNAIYFLTMNIGGDGNDVWPYAKPDDFTRFDCSKLDQWEIVFQHMQSRGLIMHVITQETENETLLDKGDTGKHRGLYYSELIARFAHHPALIWNLGEENGPADFTPVGQTTRQQQAMSDYFKTHDPYGHPVLIHSHSALAAQDHILLPLLGHKTLDGVSLQVNKPQRVRSDVVKWREKSAAAGRPWAISMDEIGPAGRGALPDQDDPGHDEVRGPVLWGSLLGGAAGVEWYFGYQFSHNDLRMEDWRSRKTLWKQTRIATAFFEDHLPFWKMKPSDQAISGGQASCLAEPGQVYAVYRAAGQADANLKLNLNGHAGEYRVAWLNPIQGGELQSGSITRINGGAVLAIGQPPSNPDQDWVALIKIAP